MAKITKDIMIGDLVYKHPEAALVLMKHGMHCVGCHIAAQESLEAGCKAHGLDDKEISKIIKEITELVQQKQSS